MHSLAIVFINKDINYKNRTEVDQEVSELLAPYDEELESPEYQQECWYSQGGGQCDHSCPCCGGRGFTWSVYNPDSRWDWWVIGGRWAGHFKEGYDPEDDPRNYETCRYCNGTGDRDDWVIYRNKFGDPLIVPGGLDTAEERESWALSNGFRRDFKDTQAKLVNGCNTCKGTGKMTVFSNAPVDEDIIPVKDIPRPIKMAPTAYVTPDGEWFSDGGYYPGSAQVQRLVSLRWEESFEEALDEYADCIAVVVDYHM